MRAQRLDPLLIAVALSGAVGCSCASPAPDLDAAPDASASDALSDARPADVGYDAHRVYPPFCPAPVPGPEALRRMGDPSVHLLPGARALTPAGPQLVLGGFPIALTSHPTLPLAYVANAGYGRRSVQVIDVSTRTLRQDIARPEVFHGIAITPDATRLYLSTGNQGLVEEYAVAADGSITATAQIAVTGYPAGLAVSRDGATLWVARFHPTAPDMPGVAEIDVATRRVRRQITLPIRPYQLLEIPTRRELWATGFASDAIAVIDLASGMAAASITVGSNPVALAATSDGATVFATISDQDEVVSIDAAMRSVRVRQPIAAGEGVDDAMGNPLHCSSPTGLYFDESAVVGGTGRLYVTRASDDAVEVLDAATLHPIGAIPVGWYPSAVRIVAGRLVTLDSKGNGVGPLTDFRPEAESGKQRMSGTATIVPLAGLDVAASTTQLQANIDRPRDVFRFTCDGTFPVPAHTGGATPIEHIVLIVRENKTYDTVLGDLGRGDSDPTQVLYGEQVTPNLHALARQFVNHDNFYSDGETSVQGHFWLTSSFVNDYVERTWLEDYRGAPGWGGDPVTPMATPDVGTFFTHLIRNHVDFRVYGEIVGSNGSVGSESVRRHVDFTFPGVFFSLDVSDESKARHVVDHINAHGLPAFTYILLPRDHTQGLSPGRPTPETMISDNDYATGIVVDGLSHSIWWEHTAIFIVEDDTQIGGDHVDYHRSPLVIASPWVRHAGTSSVHTSYTSLFRTFELILGIPPMHRLDARATPLWDAFTTTPDLAPYIVVPRRVPDAVNPSMPFWRDLSARMDFSGPDRAPGLGAMLAAQRSGVIPPELRAMLDSDAAIDEARAEDMDARLDEDDDLERQVYDREVAQMRAWLETHPEIHTDWAEMHQPR